MPRIPHRLVLLGAAVLLLLLPSGGVSGQASTYVRLGHPAYRDLEALSAVGLVDIGTASSRPYSRLQFARILDSAPDAIPPELEGNARFLEAMARLETMFAPELAVVRGEAEVTPWGVTAREVSGDFATAQSPERPMRSGIKGQGLEADLAPLLQRDFDRTLVNGQSAGMEARLEAQLSPYFSVRVDPRVGVAQVDGGEGSNEVAFVDAYARGVLGRFALEVGRNHVERGLLLSQHGPALDMIRLTTDRPFTVPWLGSVTGSALIADLGSDREFPHSKLTVLDLALRPSRHFELDLYLLNLQGGEGAPEASLLKRIGDVFLILPQDGAISDKVLGGQALFMLPDAGLYAWVSGMTTDIDESLRRPSGALWDDAAWSVGIRKAGIGGEARLDVQIEARRSGVIPHAHAQWSHGLTIDRTVVGDPLGPMASSIELGLDWTARRDVFSLLGSYETYRGDDHDGDPERTLLSDNPDENRLRAEVEWRRYLWGTNGWSTVRLGYEQVERFNFTEESRSNFLVMVALSWTP